MRSAAAALERLVDPASRVSAHYLIDEDGGTIALVPEAERAWHAGVSHWAGRDRLNDTSIGIELVNSGHAWGLRPYPEAQLAALTALALAIRARWDIGPAGVVGHSDVAPTRKEDPGELFPWQALAARGIGIWPARVEPQAPDLWLAAARLHRIGYGVGVHGASLATVLRAFQRRFRPHRVDGYLDTATMGLLTAVAGLSADPGMAS